ncbi:hypothetical protein CPB83DRAFT_786771 [Crepidotus variabilis]|uniref:Pyridoxamine 5'-phosphate oxidase N-terminal domain-containing protein n=1 Tax=Crepidotus variabilis TaxID=179855 RepID=A0A9P6JTC1_9AGAR|nr:hypothetical protein CPB83DRAFT_786771 [Crepidotus variabilis]
MGNFYDEIPKYLETWIKQQNMFWIASAALSPEGHVNVSPKGYANTFHITDENHVWYEDLSGSGAETIAHMRENGRLTIMFCAFEGLPRIVRLWGKGTIYEFGTPEYEAYLPLESRQPGSRAVIVQEVHKVGTSCGFSIPFYDFNRTRTKLHALGQIAETRDIKAELLEEAILSSNESSLVGHSATQEPAQNQTLPRAKDGLKAFWAQYNLRSLDGLPGILMAHLSTITFSKEVVGREWGNFNEDESTSPPKKEQQVVEKMQPENLKEHDVKLSAYKLLFIGMLWGMVFSCVFSELRECILKRRAS